MRWLSAVRTDMTLQARNQLYAISVGVSVLAAGALAWLTPHDPDIAGGLARTVPMALILFVGGSTLLYVVAMILLERADGTLNAVCVSPLRPAEYLGAKVATLTLLAAIEGLLIAAGAVLLLARSEYVPPPDWVQVVSLTAGLAALGVMHVLVGVVLVVRYRRIMEALMPMGGVALVLQLPAFYFVGAFDSPLLLAIPSAGPAMFLRGAFVTLEPWELGYGVLCTAVTLAVLGVWSLRAFDVHVVRRAG